MTKLKKIGKIVVVICMIITTIVMSICYFLHITYGSTKFFINLTPFQPCRYLIFNPRSNAVWASRYVEQLALYKLEGEEQYIYIMNGHAPMTHEHHHGAEEEMFFSLDNNRSFIVIDSNTVNFLIIPSYIISFVLIKDNMSWIKEDCKNFFKKWKKKEKSPTETTN